MGRMPFFKKSLEEFRVVDCLASSCSRDVELMVRRNPCIGLFLLVMFDSYVHLVSCI